MMIEKQLLSIRSTSSRVSKCYIPGKVISKNNRFLFKHWCPFPKYGYKQASMTQIFGAPFTATSLSKAECKSSSCLEVRLEVSQKWVITGLKMGYVGVITHLPTIFLPHPSGVVKNFWGGRTFSIAISRFKSTFEMLIIKEKASKQKQLGFN